MTSRNKLVVYTYTRFDNVTAAIRIYGASWIHSQLLNFVSCNLKAPCLPPHPMAVPERLYIRVSVPFHKAVCHAEFIVGFISND